MGVSLQPQGRSKTKCINMKFLLPAFLLIAVACFVSSQDIACPETDKKFKIGTSVEEVLGVPDWHACGEACGTQEKCQFWSFGPAKRIKINFATFSLNKTNWRMAPPVGSLEPRIANKQ